jgi:predicted MPP superfamily phosphohydrolase
VSDAHLGGGRGDRWLEKRVAEIRSLRPDLVVLLGDMFEGDGGAPRDLPALRDLAAPLGKWFVDGNHEAHGGGGTGAAALARAGFRRLAGGWAVPAPGLVLAGVRDPGHGERREAGGDPLGAALANRPAGATVLLSHAPRQAERAARAGVQLMLSGHTHGGQIWPFGYIVRMVHPLLAGRYAVDGMPVIVSRGAGTWGPPMRLWRRNEILKVTLRSP